jgi:23S rRNA (adenine2503-C2)-methyltransferase
MDKTNLLGYTASELEGLVQKLGEQKFKGRQLFKWLYNRLQPDFGLMTDLSLNLRRKLIQDYVFRGLNVGEISRSRDGTEKFLFRLDDQSLVESVLIPDRQKKTVCVSTQVGCPVGCSFCASGLMGFTRNLTAGEIVGQLMSIRQRDGVEAFQNVVFMGMGEPLLNYQNLVRSIGIISSEIGLSLSAKRLTVSTVGIIPGIYALADSGLKVNLAISLHAATGKKREKLVPLNKSCPLDKLVAAAAYFARKRKKRVTFEYILFRGVNDTPQDVKALARLVQGIPCKINILSYNPTDDSPYERPSEEEVDNFGKLLYPVAPAVTVRKSRGLDIEAACGQLAAKSKYVK